MSEQETLKIPAAELEASFKARSVPGFEGRDVSRWVEAVASLIDQGRLDAGEYALRHLRAKVPGLRWARRLGTVFDKIPLAGRTLPFADDPSKDVQIVASKGAETAILLFCGRAQKIGLPINLMHEWMGRLNASLVYLRDFNERHYLRGVRSFGADRAATLAELRRLVASLRAKRIVCYGNSAGVFGALHYGLDLGAEAVACVGGVTNLSPEFNAYLTSERTALHRRAEFPDATLDLRRLYSRAAEPPRVRIVYGGDHWNDRLHAEHMGALTCVSLHPLEGFDGHHAITELIARNQFDDLLDWLVSADATRRKRPTENLAEGQLSRLARRIAARVETARRRSGA